MSKKTKTFIAVVGMLAIWTLFVGVAAFKKGMHVGDADRIEVRRQLLDTPTLLVQQGQQQAQVCEELRKEEEERLLRLSEDYKRRQFNERNGIIQADPNGYR